MYSTYYVTAGDVRNNFVFGYCKNQPLLRLDFTAPSAVQTLQGDFEGTNEIFYRHWDPDDEDWSTFRTLSFSGHTHTKIVPLATDTNDASDALWRLG